MRFATVTDRLADLGSAKWAVHFRAREKRAAGHPVIELTIGEPDIPTPPVIVSSLVSALNAGRTGYSNGHGERGLLEALAARYTSRRGRAFRPDHFLCLPGTQTAIFLVMNTLVEVGDDVLVGDPMYATYEGVIRSTGANAVPVPLRPEFGFRLQASDVADRITDRTRVLFLNTPHNPTGAVLQREDLIELGKLARDHNLWIVSDEVYEDLIFPGVQFATPLDLPEIADRVVAASSISKSHAAPGLRSGWCVGPETFIRRALPLAETMLFGNQPFIADATKAALEHPSTVGADMAKRFSARAQTFFDALDGVKGLRVNRPEAGMFCLLDIRATGMSGEAFALALLDAENVAAMPGESFGASLSGWLRVSLTRPDDEIAEAARRIERFVSMGM